MTTPLAAKIAREYGTPAAVIDMDRVERNIARIQVACDAAGVANRPHIKTHKSPLLAQMQVAAGAKGITCQKLGEAEVMADAGIDDILISYNLIGDEKMARLGALQAKANMTVAADNSVVIAGLPQAAAASGRPLSVVVECDTGRKRAGVETPGGSDRAGARDRGARRADSSPASCCIRPRPAGPRRRSFSMRRWPASARTGSMRRWSRPAARRT